MTRLFLIMYTLAASVLAGTGVIVALATGRVDLPSILMGAAIGALLGVPAAWIVAKRLETL